MSRSICSSSLMGVPRPPKNERARALNSIVRILGVALTLIVLVGKGSPALADGKGAGSGPPVKCGSFDYSYTVVRELIAPGMQGTWDITITGEVGQPIGQFLKTGTGDAGGGVDFKFGRTVNGFLACDATNVSTVAPVPGPNPGQGGGGLGGGVQVPPGPWPVNPNDPNPYLFPNPNPLLPEGFGVGAVSVLNIESLALDPVTGQWVYEGAFERLLVQSQGGPVSLNIPDLFADTNSDGVIGDGDVLYSWVNIHSYYDIAPTFSLGDTLSIVDGQVVGIDGMWFSPTPIYLDPVLGPRPSGGEWFNEGPAPGALDRALSSGNSIGLTGHTITTTIPEPSSWVLLLSGFAAVSLVLRRRPGAGC